MLFKPTALLVAAMIGSALYVANASAGTYYVNACSAYGNTAPAFTSWTDSEHMSMANECMQPASGGGYRSLEINNAGPLALIYEGKTAHWIANTPSSALSIVGAYTPSNDVLADCMLHTDGFTAQFFWSGGSEDIDRTGTCNTSQGYGYATGINSSFAPSSYFGWGATCSTQTTCSTSSSIGAVLGVQGVQLTVQETSGPVLFAIGADNLWYQNSHWVRGGGWPVDFTAGDASGVCSTDLLVNGLSTNTDSSVDATPDTSNFTQCWATDAVSGTLDTTRYPNGPLTIEYKATNAANVSTAPIQTLEVDNTPVTLSLSTANDADPNLWVNHSVAVTAAASAGPSGLGGTTCSTNGGSPYAYPSKGITVDGTGVWTVSCSSRNNALDVTGQAATSPSKAVAIHIDETPPTLSFAAVNPDDPQAVVVTTSDPQSGVASGNIEMRPAGAGPWEPLAAQLSGGQLLARFDDAALAPGAWQLQATSCDRAGNCASVQKTLNLPVRVSSVSSVGFAQVKNPPARVAACARHRIKRHRRSRGWGCSRTQLVLVTDARGRFGRSMKLRGLLTTAVGRPVPGATISILAAADDGLSQYSQVASATTDSKGAWRATLPAGPSREVTAVYNGSTTIQPSKATATLIVPASVRVLRVWPRHVPWGGKVHIAAQLKGGWLPPEGALVRLRLGYGPAKITYGVKEHVRGNGVFEVTNTFGSGPASLMLHYWLQECTLPEGDYPFAPACSQRSAITVGG